MSGFRASTPQLYVDVDRTKCKMLGVAMNDVFDTLQAFLGGYYVNDFNRFGRTWQVNVQAERRSACRPNRSANSSPQQGRQDGAAGFSREIRDDGRADIAHALQHVSASPINGASLPGVSTGTIISTMDAVAGRQLPSNMKVEWTELTFLQLQEGSSAILRLHRRRGLGVPGTRRAVRKLVHAVRGGARRAHVPALSACIGIYLARMDLNIFVQVGFIVLVGLASKNAILVVEFARQLQNEGSRLRKRRSNPPRPVLRPIVMTSSRSSWCVSAGDRRRRRGEMRRTLGTAVFAGMLGVTFFGVFLTPVSTP